VEALSIVDQYGWKYFDNPKVRDSGFTSSACLRRSVAELMPYEAAIFILSVASSGFLPQGRTSHKREIEKAYGSKLKDIKIVGACRLPKIHRARDEAVNQSGERLVPITAKSTFPAHISMKMANCI
jgi:hypothetical protein